MSARELHPAHQCAQSGLSARPVLPLLASHLDDLQTPQRLLNFPCGQPWHSIQSPFSLLWTQPLHEPQCCFSLPWGHPWHIAQRFLTFPWGHPAQAVHIDFKVPWGQPLH
uniref:Uncharacterized protein n=1 Tax=Pyrodinium bahamense TaxID=73915 RepID=A0A7S0AVZ6_9DINO|mmetsp:Transcript_43199/g.120180  ORF Transcript_43199/g.120180 Transcript_43199/m.120180 type:complete len:110 (+) Transcript_43199:57-386(+)